MAILAPQSYTPKKWNLAGLQGISDQTLAVHFGLYEGYVKNTNLLNEQIAEKIKGAVSGADPGFAEITRRLGFEYNGMVLHEYYFDNMMSGGNGSPTSGKLFDAVSASFGDFETWKKDFAAVGGMRGVGWAIAFLLDYKPAERAKYIESFFANVDWAATEARLVTPASV
jgi:Fe-Mn family superoxide dismutase